MCLDVWMLVWMCGEQEKGCGHLILFLCILSFVYLFLRLGSVEQAERNNLRGDKSVQTKPDDSGSIAATTRTDRHDNTAHTLSHYKPQSE